MRRRAFTEAETTHPAAELATVGMPTCGGSGAASAVPPSRALGATLSHLHNGVSAQRKCIGVEGRTCGARLPKRARKFCRRCRKKQEKLRQSRYNRNYFQANKVEIYAQRRNHREEVRVQEHAREQAEREQRDAKLAERKKYLPAYELDLL